MKGLIDLNLKHCELYPYHLNKTNLINLGAFYTPTVYVNIVWDFIKPYINKETVILDPACGYGAFLKEKTVARKIGNDIDAKALEITKTVIDDVVCYNYNFLKAFDRSYYNISNENRLIVIGNPPYNDMTSQAKKEIKNLDFDVDPRVKARDIGISFLRAFDYLKADYVCVLHPLSYLIKKANFRLLKNFRENYVLLDGVIISSRCFKSTSKSSEFPIIIALYERNNTGMDYNYISKFLFKTIDGKKFRLSDFEYIGDFIDKYPKENSKITDAELLFYTLRDINALKRNKTFIDKPTRNAIKIDINKLDYYIYVDIFKDFIKNIPYYFGNMDILINRKLFDEYKDYFISYAIKKHPFLGKYYSNHQVFDNDRKFILEYFQRLLGEHFMEKEKE